MSEIKIHDPNIVSIERHPGDKGYWIKYKDGTEKFIEDEPMKNLRDEWVYGEIIRKPYTYPLIIKRPTKEELLKEFPDAKIINPRKKYRELRKPARPGNYQKIMKEIDEKPNEWRFRLLPPGKFHPDSFRSKEITEGVRAITGCEKGKCSQHMLHEIGRGCKKGSIQFQALRLSKSVFKTKESAARWIAAHTMTKYGKNPRVPRAFDRDTEMMIGDLMNVGVPEHRLRKLSKSQIGRAHREHFAKEYGDIEIDEIS